MKQNENKWRLTNREGNKLGVIVQANLLEYELKFTFSGPID